MRNSKIYEHPNTRLFFQAQRVDESMLARTATKILILSSCILLFSLFLAQLFTYRPSTVSDCQCMASLLIGGLSLKKRVTYAAHMLATFLTFCTVFLFCFLHLVS